MNKDKSIKDLKQYNDKIKTQLEYSKIRVWSLERENDKLQQELQRKDNIINELKNGIKELDDMFYETFRISQDGYFSISEWELKDFTDKIKELEEK